MLEKLRQVLDFLRAVLDLLLHALGGAALAAPLLPWDPSPWVVGGVFVIWGWLREGAQHRDEGAWIGWWSVHRATEGATWGAGAAVLHALL